MKITLFAAAAVLAISFSQYWPFFWLLLLITWQSVMLKSSNQRSRTQRKFQKESSKTRSRVLKSPKKVPRTPQRKTWEVEMVLI